MKWFTTLVIAFLMLLDNCSSEIHSFDDSDDVEIQHKLTKSKSGKQKDRMKLEETSNIHTKSTLADDENEVLLSKKLTSSEDHCDADQEGCNKKKIPLADQIMKDAGEFLKKTTEEMGTGGTPEKMMDTAAAYVVGMAQQYAKYFSEGKLDWKSLLSSDYVAQFTNLLMHGNMPGGNPLAASAVQLYQKVMATFTKKPRGIAVPHGINLKPVIDEANQLISEILPGFVIALQHSEPKCHRTALCRSVRAAAKTKLEISEAAGLLLGKLTATYLDFTERTKKGEYMKVVDCCSTEEDVIFNKCSKPYMNDQYCSTHLLMNTKMLKPLDPQQIQAAIMKLLPYFTKLTGVDFAKQLQ